MYRRRDAKVGEMRLKLPLDDNDYLMSSPSPSSPHSTGVAKPASAQARFPGDLIEQQRTNGESRAFAYVAHVLRTLVFSRQLFSLNLLERL